MLDANREEIVDMKKRSGVIWYLMAGRDAALKRQTKIQEVIHDVSSYDVVYIWSPVWDFTMSSAIRTYLTTYEEALPDALVFFCTQASSWADNAFQEMAKIVGKRPIVSIVYTSKEILKDSYQEDLKNKLRDAGLLK
jgi:hypothetical protein